MFLLLALALQSAARPVEIELYRAQLAAAESAIRLGELAIAREWLDRTDPARRGLEWHLHHAELDQSLLTVLTEGTHVVAIDASPDGTHVAVGLANGAIELRRASDGLRVAEIGRHAQSVSCLRFDPAGKRLVSASFDRTVKLWDVEAQRLLLDFTGHGYPVGGAAFSPDGKLVASCSYERPPDRGVVGTVHVWDPADGAIVRTLEAGRKPLVGLEFSPDGRRIAMGSWDFRVYVCDLAGGEPLSCAMPDEGLYNAVDDAAWTPDGEHVIGASKDRTARVWKSRTGELVATLRGHTDAVDELALSPDGVLLATASGDGTVKLWNTRDWSQRATLRGHADDVAACAFSADGRQLLTGSMDGTLRVWDAATDRYGNTGWTASHAAYVSRFSPDDARIATATYDGRIEVRDALTLAPIRAWDAHPSGKSCHALAWTPDGARLVSGSWEPLVKVWDAASGEQIQELRQSEGTSYLAVSPDGKLAATCSGSKVLVWNLDTYARVHEFAGHGGAVLAVAFSPDSRSCVSTGRDGKAIVWSALDGTVRWAAQPGEPDLAEAMYTPDGDEIVVAGRGGHVTLHDASSGALVRELARLRHGIHHIDVSPDGSRVALASHVVALVDLVNGGVVGELRPHVAQPYNLDFDARGERLISCSTDRTVAILDAVPLRVRLAALPPR